MRAFVVPDTRYCTRFSRAISDITAVYSFSFSDSYHEHLSHLSGGILFVFVFMLHVSVLLSLQLLET